MTAQNQRDPDGTDILGQVRDGLADLKANVISRWGRIPHVAADPTSPPDGAVWIRSDDTSFRYRDNGRTFGQRIGGQWSRVALVSIPNATVVTMAWDTETADTDNFCTPTSGLITIPTGLGGLYAITVMGSFATSPTTAALRVIAGTNTYEQAGVSVGNVIQNSLIVPLAAAETIVCSWYQTSAGAINANAKVFVHRIGA